MNVANRPPVWAVQYKRKFGHWPISGGSSDVTLGVENPPEPPAPATDPASGFPEARRQPETPPQQPENNNVRNLPPRDPATGQFVSQDELIQRIEAVRKEEKDKLYGRLNTMEEEIKRYREEREAAQREREEQEKAAAEEQKKRAEEEMSAKELIEVREREWAEKFAALEREREAERILREKEAQFASLMEYQQRRLREEEDNIIPQLRDLVTGNTPEEVEASLASLKERSALILQDVEQAQTGFRQAMPGVRPTAPPVGPLENEQSHETLSLEQLQHMDMAEYRKKREQLLRAASRQYTGGS